MNFYIINLFHLNASMLCQYILEYGYPVYGVGINELGSFTSMEEDLWMAFGRNANLTYIPMENFFVQKEIKKDAEIFYFPFEQEERNARFLSCLNKFENNIYYVQDHSNVNKEKLYLKGKILEDDEESLKQFFLDHIQFFI